MSRLKDINWNCGDNGNARDIHCAQLAVLMDLRDELKQLNRVFACPNFQSMPHEIRKLRIAVERFERRFSKKHPLK